MSNTPTHGSDVQETPDWWKASDGRFYPPELHPDYVKSAEPDPAVSAAVAPESSLADRLRAEADRVGDEASAAADAGVGSLGGTPETMSDAKSTIDGAPASAAAATSGGVADGMPLTPDSIDPRATIAQGPPAASGGATIIQRPGIPPSPGAPPTSPPSMPPMPSAPSGMPPAPGAPPSAMPEQGPGGITYTAAPPPSNFQTPVAPAAPAAKASSGTSGLMALVAGAAAIAGSLLQWGKGSVVGSNGAERAIIEVPGFDSSGLITAIAGGVLILAGILFFMGVPKQLNWAILAFLGGAVIVGAVVFSMIDIGDLSNRYAAQWQAQGLAQAGDVISTSGDIGLWITGAGGVLGILAAPFVNRS